jgi:hypothetical protein
VAARRQVQRRLLRDRKFVAEIAIESLSRK